jgi:hypothetical protein
VMETHEHRGDFKIWWSFSRFASAPPVQMICCEDNHFPVRSTSRDHRNHDSTSLRRHGRHRKHAVREANADSPGREPFRDVRPGHYKNGDRRSLFALHARQFYAD